MGNPFRKTALLLVVDDQRDARRVSHEQFGTTNAGRASARL